MSDGRRKNKLCAGTIPKGKNRNNRPPNELGGSRSTSNNSAGYWQRSPDQPNAAVRNPERNQPNYYCMMNTTLGEPNYQPSNTACLGFSFNGSNSAETSSSTSRRNSSGPSLKCDNVTKYPDKKQIEDKLHQIREYIKISDSLMAAMKNTDDEDVTEKDNLEKMISDLKDSEKKLCGVLDFVDFGEVENYTESKVVENGCDNLSEHSASWNIKNEIDVNVDASRQEQDLIREQQHLSMQLQQKAENKLRNARQLQSNLLSMAVCNNDLPSTSKECKSLADFDAAIKELEERAIKLGPAQQVTNQEMQENILAKVESLHSQILSMHNANDEREQLIEVLDNRDVELRLHQAELQNKLVELQNKKSQVDQMVSQLQTYANEEEENDVGGQVRNIVSMKNQLKTLKDMLEMVKTTENILENTNLSSEAQAAVAGTCSVVESFLEKDNQKSRLRSGVQNETNMLKYDNDTSTSSEGRPKKVNQNQMDQGNSNRGVKPSSTPSINDKFVLKSQLEMRKRELEDLMGRHKASSSNLNHDVGADVKPEYSCASNEAWIPLIAPNQISDRCSSDEDEEDVNAYTELQDNHNLLPLPNSNYSSSYTSKRRSGNSSRIEYVRPMEYDSMRGLSRTPERNVRDTSSAPSAREHLRTNTEQNNRTQVQKQLQLIKSVCESMLEQNSNNQQSHNVVNVQQLRNNLTPSSVLSEPQRLISPHPSSLNIVNPIAEVPPWFSSSSSSNPQQAQSNQNAENSNYQSWLAANAIQTQSFMLNTLNQCCQMLWLQQRELASLRNAVNGLQERQENNYYQNESVNSGVQQGSRPFEYQRLSNTYRPPIPNQKTNPVSAAFSMPNLNQYNCHNNIDPQYNMNQNNTQPSRLLDHSCLNNNTTNVSHNNQQDPANNSVLHGVNINNHHLPNQMWNGQALNNQVAPGNRANNYWDNFRSYSRQNLLSTKNNEVIQNPSSSTSIMERSNTINERTNPFTLMSFSKYNSDQDSASTSQENTPQRRGIHRHENITSTVISPLEVLNAGQGITDKSNDDALPSTSQNHTTDVSSLGFQMLNLNTATDNSSNNSEDRFCLHDQQQQHSTRHNDWNDDLLNDEQIPKSKLFEELRENVYREVASLISANEARPHFLIQLFRDLQMIGSDALRLKILQSIQMVITHSLSSSSSQNRGDRQSIESQQSSCDVDVQPTEHFSLQTTVWSKPAKNSSNTFKNIDYSEYQSFVKGILPFLNDHEEEIIRSPLISSLKEILLDSGTLKEAVKDTVFVKYFANVLDEVLEQYRGKKIRDVKIHMLQTLNELLCGELGFILFVQENNPENAISHLNKQSEEESSNFSTEASSFEHMGPSTSSQQRTDNMPNGDLAEADQSRIITDDSEQGTSGSLLDINVDVNGDDIQNECDDLDLSMDFPPNTEGLDQVPTRLPIKAKSRSATPNKDPSYSSDTDRF